MTRRKHSCSEHHPSRRKGDTALKKKKKKKKRHPQASRLDNRLTWLPWRPFVGTDLEQGYPCPPGYPRGEVDLYHRNTGLVISNSFLVCHRLTSQDLALCPALQGQRACGDFICRQLAFSAVMCFSMLATPTGIVRAPPTADVFTPTSIPTCRSFFHTRKSHALRSPSAPPPPPTPLLVYVCVPRANRQSIV